MKIMTNIAYYRAIKFKAQGQNFGFTDYPEDIIIDNTTYNSAETVRIENITLNSTLNNTYTTFIIHYDNYIKDILDHNLQVVVEIFYIKVFDNKIDLIKLKTGRVSQVKAENNKLIIEVESIINQLSNSINRKYTTNCKACFSDNQCKINKENYIIKNVKVINIVNDLIEIDMTNAMVPPQLLNLNQDILRSIIENGFVLDNNQLKYAKIIKYTQKQLKIDNIGHNRTLHDYINLQCQCDKSFVQCKTVFSNQIQFRGEIVF